MRSCAQQTAQIFTRSAGQYLFAARLLHRGQTGIGDRLQVTGYRGKIESAIRRESLKPDGPTIYNIILY
jgi:hypothetical protein